MAPKKVNWELIDPAVHFRFAAMPVKGSSHDGHSIPLRIADPESGEEIMFIHQAPELFLPFGIVEKEINDKVQYKATLSFPTVRFDTQKQDWIGKDMYVKYYKWIESIDDYNRNHVFQHMKTWFPSAKPLKKDVLDEFYFANTWVGDKCLAGEYSPTFSTKLCVRSDAIVTKFYNDAYEECTYQEVSGDKGKGLRVVPLIRATGIWFAGKNFGMSYQVIQMLFFRRNQFVGCAIDIGEAADHSSIADSVGSPLQIEIENDESDEENSKARTTKRRKKVSSSSSSSNSNVASNFNFVEN